VTPISLIFLRINEHRPTGQLLMGPNPMWSIQPKVWVSHGSHYVISYLICSVDTDPLSLTL